jgi:hypothetical protein
MNKQKFKTGSRVQTYARRVDNYIDCYNWHHGGGMVPRDDLKIQQYDSSDNSYQLNDGCWYHEDEIRLIEPVKKSKPKKAVTAICDDTSVLVYDPVTFEPKAKSKPEPTSSKFNLNFGY